MPEVPELAAALARHFAEHNRQASLLALGTMLVSLLLWVLLYFVAQWLTLLVVTVIGDGTAPLPRGFSVIFLTATVCLLAYAWVVRRLTPDERPRDKKTPAEIAEEVVLALPRATLFVFSTLRARQHLSASEIDDAAVFLRRLMVEQRMPMPAAGYDLPEANSRERILFALQLTGVIDVLHARKGSTISLGLHLPTTLQLKPGR